ncbi:heterokaryon incompatibility protein-domain-containing protein [Nemania sp. NC0429]|nr:heterokaryon incompatibility protein-domain-containing protein [Nemania sp. NC0429]
MESPADDVDEMLDALDALSIEELHAYAGLYENIDSYDHMVSYAYTKTLLSRKTHSPDHQMEMDQKLRQWVFHLPSDSREINLRTFALAKMHASLDKHSKKLEGDWLAIRLHGINDSLVPWNDTISKAHTVLDIVQQLCARDERFVFIKSAINVFIEEIENHPRYAVLGSVLGELSPSLMNERWETWSREDYSKVMSAVSLHMDYIWNTDGNAEDSSESGHQAFGMNILVDIINSSIYEILWVFNIDLPEPPTSRGQSSEGVTTILSLLQKVFSQSQSMEPVLMGGTTHRLDTSEPNKVDAYTPTYKYTGNLESSVGHVRVLQILPGDEEATLECRLTECDLYEDGIPEALSYVWGSEKKPQAAILIDEELFFVTTRLHEILQRLRRADEVRTIWVDAICINQANMKEKVHQVRLMRDIYSSAKSVIIWLADSDARVGGDASPQTNCEPFPEGFEGVTTNQYDLSAMVDECQKYSNQEAWSREVTVLHMMLWITFMHIVSNEWWERVWTLQEVILSKNVPIFHFKGHHFSLDAFIAARRIIIPGFSGGKYFKKMMASVSDKSLKEQFWRSTPSFTPEQVAIEPLACAMRRSRIERNGEDGVTLGYLLIKTAMHRASNPSDKVFALESLLPRSLGRLIKVDYHEDIMGSVFRRILAQYYCSGELELIRCHPFLYETQRSPNMTLDAPSWVLDMTTYTLQGVIGGVPNAPNDATLDGYLFASTIYKPPNVCEVAIQRFATPWTLFSGARCIDQISATGPVPVLDERDIEDTHVTFVLSIFTAAVPLTDWDSLQQPPEYELMILDRLFCLANRFSDVKHRDSGALLKARNLHLAGKPYFVTENGIVGIATAPIEPGDTLVWLHDAPIYLILREVEEGKGKSTTQRHKIVARAAIAEGFYNTKSLIDNAPDQQLQII